MGRTKHINGHVRGVSDNLYYEDPESYFFMVSSDLMEAEAVHNLSYRQFYTLMACHSYKEEPEHSHRLYEAFKTYFEGIGEPKEDIELKLYAGTAGKSQKTFNHEYFIFPPDASKRYGLKFRNHVTEDLDQLEKKGFIRTFYKPPPIKRGEYFRKDSTIYEFITKWKKA